MVTAAPEKSADPAIVKQISQAWDVILHRVLVQRNLAVVVGPGASEQACAGWTTYRLGTVGPVEDSAALGQFIHAGNLDEVVTVRGEGGARLLISDDQKQVWRLP